MALNICPAPVVENVEYNNDGVHRRTYKFFVYINLKKKKN